MNKIKEYLLSVKEYLLGNKDKLEHFCLGVLSIIFGILAISIYQDLGFGWFSAFTTTSVGILYEIQQWYRKEGFPSVADAVATSIPGWLLLLWTKI